MQRTPRTAPSDNGSWLFSHASSDTVEAEFLESSHLGSHFLISASVDKDMQYMYESTCTLNSYIHRTRVLLHLVPRSSTTCTLCIYVYYCVYWYRYTPVHCIAVPDTCSWCTSPVGARLTQGIRPYALCHAWAYTHTWAC